MAMLKWTWFASSPEIWTKPALYLIQHNTIFSSDWICIWLSITIQQPCRILRPNCSSHSLFWNRWLGQATNNRSIRQVFLNHLLVSICLFLQTLWQDCLLINSNLFIVWDSWIRKWIPSSEWFHVQLTPKDFYLPVRLCGAPFDYKTYAETAGFELNTNKNVPFGLGILINKSKLCSQMIFRLQMDQLKFWGVSLGVKMAQSYTDRR